ncbi:hypothetical protein WR25_09635 [Diploscapter pachys]|uniref:Ribosomal RNA-processing protein 8 n=1 Tax=Diploscapter pachys TaxID=2018661 RepID=A0A2A2J4W5_9BILA|nr:hypothetical protein WR25_09635 [Diploscapter pachys]
MKPQKVAEASKAIQKSDGGIVKEKKKKRSWRNKVRKLAKKKRLAEERATAAANGQKLPGQKNGDKAKRKKKKKNKQNEETQNEDEPESGQGKVVKEEEPQKPKMKAVVSMEEAQQRMKAGRFRYLNEMMYTVSGADAMEYFQKDPDAFQCYHNGFAEQAAKWPNHPLHQIIKWLAKQSGKVVLDLGCGEAKIAKAAGHLHQISSFDLVSQNERVTACDMAHLPVESDSADIAIFCLSLMGTNLHEYIREAHRTLKMGGVLKIAEVSSRFTNIKLFVDAVQKMGFKNTEKKTVDDYFVMLQFSKSTAKCENKKPFGLNLKPCLYKKR